MAAPRYVALNPVTAGLVERAQNWPWSSVRAHLDERNDGLVEVAPLLARTVGRQTGCASRRRRRRPTPGSEAFRNRVAALTGRNPGTGKPDASRRTAPPEQLDIKARTGNLIAVYLIARATPSP